MATLPRIVAAIPPGSGSVVMGTGIVSIALWFDGPETLSRILLAVAAAVWIALALAFVVMAVSDFQRVRHDARTPPALTGVAGTAVLATRLELLGWTGVAIALLVLALAMCVLLLVPVLRHWDTPTVGASFALPVAIESLAVLAATLAEHADIPWLLDASIAPFALGLVAYVFVIARFDLRQLTAGYGDQWIAGGALAISALAAGTIAPGSARLQTLVALNEPLKDLSAALWIAAIAWLAPLIAAEVLRPRLRYGVARWSTVFPVGMYGACSFAVGSAVHAPAISDFARAWVWIALAVWVAAFVAMVRRCLTVARGDRASPTRSP